jgi:hypothetical protein
LHYTWFRLPDEIPQDEAVLPPAPADRGHAAI